MSTMTFTVKYIAYVIGIVGETIHISLCTNKRKKEEKNWRL